MLNTNEAACLAGKRQDVINFYVQNGWNPTNHLGILNNWWGLNRGGAGDESGQFASLDDYAVAKGCRGANLSVVPPASAPPSGGGQAAAPPNYGTPPNTATSTLMKYLKDDWLLVGLGLGAAFLILKRR